MTVLENYWEYVVIGVVLFGVLLAIRTIIKSLSFGFEEMSRGGESFKKPSFLKSLIAAFIFGLLGEVSLRSHAPTAIFELIYRFAQNYNLLGYDLLISDFFIIRFAFSFIPAVIGSLTYSLFYYYKHRETIGMNILSFILINLGTILTSALIASILVIMFTTHFF